MPEQKLLKDNLKATMTVSASAARQQEIRDFIDSCQGMTFENISQLFFYLLQSPKAEPAPVRTIEDPPTIARLEKEIGELKSKLTGTEMSLEISRTNAGKYLQLAADHKKALDTLRTEFDTNDSKALTLSADSFAPVREHILTLNRAASGNPDLNMSDAEVIQDLINIFHTDITPAHEEN